MRVDCLGYGGAQARWNTGDHRAGRLQLPQGLAGVGAAALLDADVSEGLAAFQARRKPAFRSV